MGLRWDRHRGKLARDAGDWRPAELLAAVPTPGFAEAVARTAMALAPPEAPHAGPYDELTFAAIGDTLGDPLGDPLGKLSPPDEAPVFPSEGPEGHRARMRDRLLDRGPDGLADYELLEMLLFLVQPRGDTKPLAKRLINRFGSYANTLAASPADLCAVAGVGRHTVGAVKLMQAGALRLARAEVLEKPVLGNWDQLMAYLNAAMARERVEQFRILFLDTKNRLIADELQGRGTINHTPVYPREVARRALELHAASLILVHNHPSGDPTPSVADLDMTTQIQRLMQSLGIALHDHIIVGNGSWTSLRKEGFL